MTQLIRFRYVVVGLLVLAVAAAAVGAGATIYRRVYRPHLGYAGPGPFVDIPTGMPIARIGERLVEAGVVPDRLTFRVAYLLEGRGRSLQAGEYRFEHPMTPVEVIDKLARGEVYLRAITFPEGLTIVEMAALYETAEMGTAEAFLREAREPDLIRDLDPEASDLEGYLFPDTYRLPRTATARDLVRLMVQRFRQTFDAELRAEAERRGLSTREAVTLAALVEKETARAAERPLVAAVYVNRLRIGMGLQCDPTVIYALQRAGRYDGNLTRADLAFDSPYNTYRYPGLPPGPIAAPGQASLEAALRPADVPYLYFVSRNDGTHVFSQTLQEHNRNVQEHQVRFFRERRRQEAENRRQ